MDAAYLAGRIDGEGSIFLTRLHRGQNRQLALSISSTERPILEWVLAVTRVGKITTKRTARPHHAPGFTYMVGNRQAIALLAQVEPHLRSYHTSSAGRDSFLRTMCDLRPAMASTTTACARSVNLSSARST
ncbi:MAG: LAGLIDADG family homing endonuclease [Gammaproteobacteria bacterium]